MIPEHNPVEIVEDDEEQDAEHEHEPSPPDDPRRPTVRDVLVAALAQRLPCPVCASTHPCRCARPEDYSQTEARATLIEQALIRYGHLPDPADDDDFDPEEVAQWLASRSGFPRYTDVENGWRRLLESERDVELAAIKAAQRVPSSESELVKAGKAALLDWHQSRTRHDEPESV